MTLDDVITLAEAAEIAGRAEVTMRRAASLGKLDARRIGAGAGSRVLWITTRAGVAEYLAYVASVAWANAPQHQRRPGGHRKRSRRRHRARAD